MKQTAKYLIGTALGVAAVVLLRKALGVKGIGATKRRIFKEISLAQKAGVDFEKKYDELSDKEIKALQKVSNDTGYTETYYKSLKKAYDAVSGIGTTYDVMDADGNTVLIWTDDPKKIKTNTADDPERLRALQEARLIDEERQYALDSAVRDFEEREKKLAERRKRLNKAGRSQQMALFGVGYTPARKPFWYGIPSVQFVSRGEWSDPEIYYRGHLYNAVVAENELYAIWRDQIEYGDTELNFEDWMSKVGGDYLKQDVIPYLQTTD